MASAPWPPIPPAKPRCGGFWLRWRRQTNTPIFSWCTTMWLAASQASAAWAWSTSTIPVVGRGVMDGHFLTDLKVAGRLQPPAPSLPAPAALAQRGGSCRGGAEPEPGDHAGVPRRGCPRRPPLGVPRIDAQFRQSHPGQLEAQVLPPRIGSGRHGGTGGPEPPAQHQLERRRQLG